MIIFLLANIRYKPITTRSGYFSSGKFDQFQRNIPCSAVVSALRGLVQQLLAESEVELSKWRENFKRALGTTGRIITDVIPEMELIIGTQPQVQELPPIEAQNRFNNVFTNFLHEFAKEEHPLVIFLDDLQWADMATFKLIELIMLNQEIRYLFFLGAYRDNEVTATHPLIITIAGLKATSAIINEVNLGPLNNTDVSHLIEDTLHRSNKDVAPLVELILRKTGGNPFFINQSLKRLYDDRFIQFIPYSLATAKGLESFGWVWDINAIKQLNITDNVVEILLHKLKKLPPSTQTILSMAACIGDKFDLNIVSIITDRAIIDSYQELMPAIREELILSNSSLEITKEDILTAKPIIMNFKFLHDRVQQAAYALLDEAMVETIHYNIGRTLVKHYSAALNGNIFMVVDHLNKGRNLVKTAEELHLLAKLNLQAAKKAKESTAYIAALSYLQVGMDKLPQDIWDMDYELAKEIYKERASIEYLNANDANSEHFIYAALEYMKTAIEKADFLHMLIVQYTMGARYKEAIQTARYALSLVNIELPKDEADLIKARDKFLKEAVALINGNLSALKDLQPMRQPNMVMAMRLLTALGPPCYRTHQRLWAVIIPIEVSLCLKYGDVSSATYTYPSFGGLLGYVFNDFKSIPLCVELTEGLCRKYNNPSDRSVAYLMIGSSLRPWHRHLKYAEKDYNEAYQAGLESGNLQYAGYAFGHNAYCMYYRGKTLDELEGELPGLIQFSKTRQNQWAIDLITGIQLVVANLQDKSNGKFSYEKINETDYLHKCTANNNIQVLCIYNIMKMQVLFLYGKFDEAINASKEANDRIIAIATQSLLPTAEYRFYYALLIAALYDEASEKERTIYKDVLIATQNQMRIWAESCPENFLHKYYLIGAEVARITGKDMEAINLYRQAIESSKEQGFIQVEALANERMAMFWLQKNNSVIAKIYMVEAVYWYSVWGAKCKVADLKIKKYPALFETIQKTEHYQTFSYTTTVNIADYDLVSVMKSTQIISSEISMDKLLSKMMKIIMETSGAHSGAILFLSQEGKLLLEAYAHVDEIRILNSMALDNNKTQHVISEDIVYYVARTCESLVINDAMSDTIPDNIITERFRFDYYIRQYKPKSILALPILHMKKLIGVLYLENNLTASAFPLNRINVLNILVPQMAISIENAKLYENLKQIIEKEVNNSRQKDYLLISQAKLASLGELLINIAHQWRQPLMAIKSTVFDIKDAYEYGELDKAYLNEKIEKVSAYIQYLSFVIDNFRTLYKPSSKDEIYDIRQCIDETIALIYERYKTSNIIFQYSCCIHGGSFDKAASILCCSGLEVGRYKNELIQVLLNLINNSVDAIEENRIKRKLKETDNGIVEISFCKIDNVINIKIKDNGGGIQNDIVDKVFEPYFTTKFKKQGTGLGLYMSKTIIEKHMGGTLTFKNIDDGVEFKIELYNTVRH